QSGPQGSKPRRSKTLNYWIRMRQPTGGRTDTFPPDNVSSVPVRVAMLPELNGSWEKSAIHIGDSRSVCLPSVRCAGYRVLRGDSGPMSQSSDQGEPDAGVLSVEVGQSADTPSGCDGVDPGHLLHLLTVTIGT